MVRIRNLLPVLILIFLSSNHVIGQRIRKDHKEMTPSERNAYVNALKAIQPNVTSLVATHAGAVSSAHGTQLFFPWHRMYILDFEDNLRMSSGSSQSSFLTVPYWDWRIHNSQSTIDWDDQGFLGQFSNPTNFTWFGNLGKRMNTEFPVSASELQHHLDDPGGTFNLYEDFRIGMENHHGDVHCWISNVMCNVNISPRDPSFALHHGFMDKIWQEWEDKSASPQSVLTATTMPNYPVNPNSIIDSRVQDVWYAFNRKLLLDGLRSNFNSSGSKTYCYVAWNGSTVEGTIYAGDVQRNASDDVIPDNKGGFIVQSGTTEFSAGSAIELHPGFSTVYGAIFSAQIVDKPCGYTTNMLVSQQQEEEAFLKAPTTNGNSTIGSFKVYPNPVADVLNVEYNVEEDTPLSIDLVNTVGQTVFTKNYGVQSKGIFSTSIQTADLAKGFYTIIVKAGGKQSVQKVVH